MRTVSSSWREPLLRSPLALRSDDQVLRRERHQQVMGIFLIAQPAWKLVVREYRQHAVVDRRDELVGRNSDDGEGALP